jgi:hypothetical protein
MIRSLLSVVQAADNLPPHPHSPYPTHSPDGAERYVPLHLTLDDHKASLPPIGLLRPEVVRELRALPDLAPGASEGQESEEGRESVFGWSMRVSTPLEAEVPKPEGTDLGQGAEKGRFEGLDCVYFSDWVLSGGPERISSALADIVGIWRAQGKFPGPLAGRSTLSLAHGRLSSIVTWRLPLDMYSYKKEEASHGT